MSNNWIDQMSQQMEHHEVEAPKGLWEGIEQRMEARKRGRRAKLVWVWRAGAAAAVVAGVVVGVQVWNASEKEGDVQLAQTEQPKPKVPVPMQKENAPADQSVASALTGATSVLSNITSVQTNATSAQTNATSAQTNATSAQANMASAQTNIAPQLPETAMATTEETANIAPATDAPIIEKTATKTPPPAPQKNDAPLLAGTNTEETEDFYIVAVPHEKEGGEMDVPTAPSRRSVNRTTRRVSFQLMAMATGEFSQDYDADSWCGANQGLKNPGDSVKMESQRRAKPVGPAHAYRQMNTAPLYGEHDFPVKVGATLRVPLGRRFALDGGLSYTLMRSELAFFAPNGQRQGRGTQQVNYLGVPVALTADLWQNRWWSIYASAGGEVAKSVKTTWRTAGDQSFDVAERPWQWSVSAAVGVQFNVTQHVGLYAQPSADYYFDNHSMVQTYYNDHPFTPALRMGVRVKL